MNKNVWQFVIPIIILVLLVGGYFYWKQKQKTPAKIDNNSISSFDSNSEIISNDEIQKKITDMKKDLNSDDQSKINTKDFSNSDHNVSLKYPDNWQESDLGGTKNVTEPLVRENVVYFYLPISEAQNDNPNSSLVNAKLLRFVLGDDASIKNEDDWFNYIKKKVDDFIANPDLSNGYQLISLDKGPEIDGKFVVEENYTEGNLLRGKDYYIFNDRDMYQFVTKTPLEFVDNYLPQIETIVKSFKIQ